MMQSFGSSGQCVGCTSSDGVERVRGVLPEGRVGEAIVEAIVVVRARADELGLRSFCPFGLHGHRGQLDGV
jgi:hypothetical protein